MPDPTASSNDQRNNDDSSIDNSSIDNSTVDKTGPAEPPQPHVCVVGSGPAGLVVAVGLARQGLTVTVLESGEIHHDDERQMLSAGEAAGDPINAINLVENRTRRLAGNANAWVVKTAGQKDSEQMGLRYGLINRDDVEVRPWIESSGWPVTFEDLDPWLHSAHEHFAIGADDYDPPAAVRPTALGDDFWTDFDAKWFRFGLSDRYRSEIVDELRNSPLVHITTDATVTELRRSAPDGPIERVEYRTADGATAELAADVFVLACGAIENARLLLVSDQARGGIGNENGNVGRHYMDHPLFSIGHIEIEDEGVIDAMGFFDLAPVGGEVVHGYATTSRALTEELQATQIAFSIFPRPSERQLAAAESLKWFVLNPKAHLSDIGKLRSTVTAVVAGLDYFPRAAYNSMVRHRSLLPGYGRGGWAGASNGMGFSRLEVVFQCEQPPMADSRVTLSAEVDRFGSPLPRVEWRLGEQVKRSVLAVQRRLADHVDASGLGTYVPRAGSFDELGVPSSMAHHLGTTRMSLLPENGVVTADCRVHSTPNLFVTGSSVFPTSGYINPTLTIVALAERLADHIAKRAEAPPSS